ncbi:TPA: phage antirepressor N-terminal domain-containing protein [Salmonella enterica subsp. enterica serovar Newport]|uniref:phage antirepressor N-terminal domain-containing protein n=1 Tax=Salmonella enterica TaxID=28901 RepID=UPI0002BB212B|nr:phage antirepressor N-terminal domain-containing protein [Salmonella enterica]EMG75771.1 antirepressor protein [Salmonella enterica subsp. enterica serovar Newport str. JS09102]MDJ3552698.1 phage antirepressor N-terminal domain-containing protein [Salmonella enterica]MDJ3669347.1 phage antirepressor N-terminal domain-containing protein [Salmonella enterica]
MKSIATAVSTINVPFHGAELYVVNHNGEPYTPMKPIVEGMGMDWASQFTKLKQRFAKGIVEIAIPSVGGVQNMICLALRKLNGWLQTISPNKVRPEIRDNVIQYQEECDDVLYEYWTKGHVVNPRKAKKALPGKITTEQQEAIKQLVMSRGQSLPKEKQAKAMITMWSSLKSHFGCSYKEISEEQFTEALSLAARVPLEGEFIGKQEELPAPKLDINFPISWFSENAPYAIIRQQCGDTVALDRSALVECSPAYKLIDILTKAGYDVSAVRAELKALRHLMAEQSWALKEIASFAAIRDRACHSIKL